jgi:hypothetical protein
MSLIQYYLYYFWSNPKPSIAAFLGLPWGLEVYANIGMMQVNGNTTLAAR